MKTLPLTLAGMLLASTAVLAPGIAFAQPAQSPTPTPPPADADNAEGEVDEVIVLGGNIPAPMRETSEVATFLAAEDLERQGDDTAAIALTRVTGLSLIGGRYVYVRGLGERYSSALLNGSPLPSPEPLQRVIPLDLFPSNILAGTSVQKTYSPNFPGEFGGGVINLETIGVPNEPFLSMGASVGGNTETTGEDGLIYYGSDTDRFGFDNGTRDVPDLLADAIATGDRVSDGNFTPVQLQLIGQSFVNAPLNLLQRSDTIPANLSFDLSAGYNWSFDGGDVGIVAVAGFDTEWRTRRGVQQEGAVVGDDVVVVNDYAFESTQNDITINGLVGIGLNYGDHKLRWTNLYIRSVQKEARTREGYNTDRDDIIRTDYTEWFERELFNSQIAGTHDFEPWQFQWRAAYANSSREAPYEKMIEYALDGTFYEHDASREQNATRFSTLDDTVMSAGFDVRYTLGLSAQRDAIFSAGYAYYDNERSSVSREFKLLALNNSLPEAIQRERVDFLLADFNIRPDLLVLRETTGSQGAAAYDAALRTHGVYGQVDAEIFPLIRIAIGVRYEDAVQSVTPLDLFGGPPPFAPAPLENAYWLPAATVTWNFAENLQLRLGASRTIARPQFRELAPQLYTDPESDRKFIGNPFLVDSELTNLDARLEWYFSGRQFLTVGAFYKLIDKPVESLVFSPDTQTFLNAPEATLMGAEVEFKLILGPFGDSGWLADTEWLFQANYTYTSSNVSVSAGDLVYPLETNGVGVEALLYLQDGVRLQGQSDHLANIQFGLENENTRTQATLLLTYVSERITARGRAGQPDYTQEPGVRLDFTFRQGFIVRGQEFKFGVEARNLLGTPFEEIQTQGAGIVFVNAYEVGSSVSVSLSATF